MSHERDYNVAIDMLKRTSATIVPLSEGDYARYVLDQWDWRDRFDDYISAIRSKRGRMNARRGEMP